LDTGDEKMICSILISVSLMAVGAGILIIVLWILAQILLAMQD
jgi:hypothetical protein